jgi:hypothetical protein
MTRLKAQNKELRMRPPIEEWTAAQHGYRPKQDDNLSDSATGVISESALPEFEP